RVQDELGGVDILVNNAGVMLLGPFSPELSDDYRRMIETNLLGRDHRLRRLAPAQRVAERDPRPAYRATVTNDNPIREERTRR
ncbi:MAG: SDR family NAD(P)-dependent oxidoreductase, partial [Solirubrobacteraceae bacterium]